MGAEPGRRGGGRAGRAWPVGPGARGRHRRGAGRQASDLGRPRPKFTCTFSPGALGAGVGNPTKELKQGRAGGWSHGVLRWAGQAGVRASPSPHPRPLAPWAACLALLRPPLGQRSALPLCINADPQPGAPSPGRGRRVAHASPCPGSDRAALVPALGWRAEGPAIAVMAKLAGRGLASDSGPEKPALSCAASLGDRSAGPWGPSRPVLDLTV